MPRSGEFLPAIIVCLGLLPAVCGTAAAQEADSGAEPAPPGLVLPDSNRLRIGVRFMAGYGHDQAQFGLGFEKQGRVGYAIVDLWGALNDRVAYRFSFNPVDETEPLPACGEEGYFYPNDPAFLGSTGPNVTCDPNGNRRVDMYKFIALDPINQQGPIREAWVSFQLAEPLALRFGRFILPMGFGWEEAGSFTAKDATRIQRINAEGNFGLMFTWSGGTAPGRRRPGFVGHAAGVLGDGNRNRDYDYFYFEESDLDSNSALTVFLSALFSPTDALDVRITGKRGFTGSRVERLPNYWASKRHDHAFVVSARFQPIRYAAIFGEGAHYTWGPTRTSAELLGLDESPIRKNGYYVGAELAYPLTDTARAGITVTREELSRDDSLVKFMEANGEPGVRMGETDRGTVLRVFVDLPRVTLGFYRNFDETPFPFLSGIVPVDTPDIAGATNKWGIVVRAVLD
jgi:hypothetical protein